MSSTLVELIDRELPQTQCGKCGHGGCLPYAEAIASGAAINRCPPGGAPTIVNLGRLLQQEPSPLDPEVGPADRPRVAFIREAECIGCTKCIQACPVDAILGAAKLMHTVLSAECTGCELCIDPCPVDCIDLLDLTDDDETHHAQVAPAVRDYRRQRYRARLIRLGRDARARGGIRAVPQIEATQSGKGTPATAASQLEGDAVTFSREQARAEIAAAVARVKARRADRD